jgi:hypothetical protein
MCIKLGLKNRERFRRQFGVKAAFFAPHAKEFRALLNFIRKDTFGFCSAQLLSQASPIKNAL